MTKNWIIRNQGSLDDATHLSDVLGIELPLAKLLVQRGIKTYDEAKKFFRPQLSDLHDPFLMTGMDAAIERIASAIQNKEKILIYGDYDVDGTTSVAMLFSFFKKQQADMEYYIPDRYTEGYGVSFKGVDYAINNGFKLIITIDCGIKAMERVTYGKNHGVDFIICDHHTPSDTIPDAVAVLDPKRVDCPYPFKELSGCGVGFKLIQAYSQKYNLDEETVFDYLDLVVVSIASDIVPLVGENRILAHFGLIKLSKNPRMGLKAIMESSHLLDRRLTIEDIVFKIGPRINAAGRIESGRCSVDLLMAEDATLAVNRCNVINAFNTQRRNIDNTITREALAYVIARPELQKRKSTVLFNSKWHKGVVGIVASRLIDTWYKPTIILTESNGLITGSARSVPGFDLYKAVESCSDLLENFGGHMYAAGLTLKKENLEKFMARFEQTVQNTIEPHQLVPVVEIDTVISLFDITEKFYRIIKQFQPFGPENMAPVFMVENVVDNGQGRMVGVQNEHLKLNLIQENEPFKIYQAIGFNLAQHYTRISSGQPFDVCFTLDENNFRGIETIQLKLKDVKFDS
jgi:single-stranded-DNA-specific exonuclease